MTNYTYSYGGVVSGGGGSMWPVVTTGSSASTGTVWISPQVSTVYPYPPVTPSAGHVPSYAPAALAEDELAWLRRRITEVTDLFPVAA